ncbi:histidine phosphatase family protein [Chelatococcus reniformis]|uniref:Phosphoglycerate mutase n=1 Tax=Chelatococcus reniformis TaxID=1494448 RepID=A0A916U727_9HYPH|nr:histidine phosphatase family protein [Chelatococcus reniformis]GGC61787.1 phosphoglycerate mutase [Chelatococcus reniformis]
MSGPETGAGTAAAPTLYFVRHGETDWNAAGRLQGRRDTELNATGRRQAEASGRALRALIAAPAELAYVSSPLRRARATMEGLRHAIGLAPAAYALDERLMELSFGRWEGLTWREIRTGQPRLHGERKARIWDFVPPGGESYADLAARLTPFVRDLVRDTVIVSHGGVARALAAGLAGVATAEAVKLDIWQGRVLVFAGGRLTWSEGL